VEGKGSRPPKLVPTEIKNNSCSRDKEWHTMYTGQLTYHGLNTHSHLITHKRNIYKSVWHNRLGG
jgi:hypothetical protein